MMTWNSSQMMTVMHTAIWMILWCSKRLHIEKRNQKTLVLMASKGGHSTNTQNHWQRRTNLRSTIMIKKKMMSLQRSRSLKRREPNQGEKREAEMMMMCLLHQNQHRKAGRGRAEMEKVKMKILQYQKRGNWMTMTDIKVESPFVELFGIWRSSGRERNQMMERMRLNWSITRKNEWLMIMAYRQCWNGASRSNRT